MHHLLQNQLLQLDWKYFGATWNTLLYDLHVVDWNVSIDYCFTEKMSCWKYYISFLVDVSLFEKEVSKISSQQVNLSPKSLFPQTKPQKIANPQNKVQQKFHAVTGQYTVFWNVTKLHLPLGREEETRRRKPEKLFLQHDSEILWGLMLWDKTPCMLWNCTYDKNSVESRYCKVRQKI